MTRVSTSVRTIAPLVLLLLSGLPAVAGAAPRPNSAEMVERIRQVKRIEALRAMSGRWESERRTEGVLGPNFARMGEAERGNDEDGIGLSQRPTPWTRESTGPPRAAVRAMGPLGPMGPLGAESAQSYARNVVANNPALDDGFQGDAQGEPGIAAWDRFVVVAWNDGRGQHDASFPGFIGYAYSIDGGQTFTQGGVPPSTLPGAAGPGTWTSDPVLTVNEKTGDFYFCGLFDPYSDSETLHSVAVVRLNFIGNTLTWSAPHVVRSLAGDFTSVDVDKPWIAADRKSVV